MDENNLGVKIDVTEQMAEGMVPAVKSRRERRKMHQAQNAAPVVETPAEEVPVSEAPVTPSLFDDKPLEGPAGEEPTKIFVPGSIHEPAVETDVPTEPTTEEVVADTPVVPAEDKVADVASLFDEFDSDDSDSDEDEEEDESPKGRRSFFSRRNRDEEDEDEEEENDEEEDDEEDEDDYDRFDEDDDDDDDDDEHRPFGYHLINFFKGLLEFILVLLVIILALNILDFYNVVSLDSAYNRYHDKAPIVLDTLFPSHKFKTTEEVVPAATEAPGIEPASTPETDIVPGETNEPDAMETIGDTEETTEAPVEE